MANRKPIVWFSVMGECAEADCACTDPAGLTPMQYWVEQDNPGEQDCACPDTSVPPTRQQIPQAGPYVHASPLYRAPLPDRHEIVFAPSPLSHVAVVNAPARRVLDAYATPRRLSQVTEALPDLDVDDISRLTSQLTHCGVLEAVSAPPTSCQTSPRMLTAWLHTTDRCNLQCTYCYAATGKRDMDEATGLAAVEAMFRSAARHGFRAVKLKYAGGEPTLNFPFVCSLHVQAQTLAARYGDLELHEVLLSNGVALTDSTMLALRDMGIRLAVSLDGIGEVHDAQRGAGTFTKVSRSIERAIGLGLRPHISVTITAQNAGSLGEVINYTLERSLPLNLNFYREHSCTLQGRHLMADTEHLISGLREALSQVKQHLSGQIITGGLLDRANLGYPHTRPCGAGQNYVAIDPLGNLARCHMELDKTVGSIWREDPLRAVRTSADEWRNQEVDAKQGCTDCTWRYYCAGGCPLLAHRLMGQDDEPSPYCSVYRTLLPELLHLEGLRLLRRGPPAA